MVKMEESASWDKCDHNVPDMILTHRSHVHFEKMAK